MIIEMCEECGNQVIPSRVSEGCTNTDAFAAEQKWSNILFLSTILLRTCDVRGEKLYKTFVEIERSG